MNRKSSITIYMLGITWLFLHPQGGQAVAGQDPVFSQFFAAPVYLNPAFAGAGHCSRIALNVQHTGFAQTGISTFTASFDTYAGWLQGGLGMLITSDNPGGALMRTQIGGMYAYHLRAGRDLGIHFGLQASYVRNDYRWDLLDFVTEEPPPAVTGAGSANFATGLLLYSGTFYGGMAAHHITHPNLSLNPDSLSRLAIKYSAHAGLYLDTDRGKRRLRSGRDYFVSPNVILQSQGHQTHMSYGLYAGTQPIMAGVWFRHWLNYPLQDNNTLVFLLGISIGNYRIGYSYDYSLAPVTPVSLGVHEISLSLQFGCPTRNIRSRILNCPTF